MKAHQFNRLQKRLRRKAGEAIADYHMLADGDPCNLCGSQDNLQRVRIKKMLAEWERETPNRVVSIFKSLQRVTRSHLLDKDLYDFASMSVANAASLDEPDAAFDPPVDLLRQSA